MEDLLNEGELVLELFFFLVWLGKFCIFLILYSNISVFS